MNETSLLLISAEELLLNLQLTTSPVYRLKSMEDRDVVDSRLEIASKLANSRAKFLAQFEPVRSVVLKATLAIRREPPKSASNRLELLAKLSANYIFSIDNALFWFAAESSYPLEYSEWRTNGDVDRIDNLRHWLRETQLSLDWGDLIKQVQNSWSETHMPERPTLFELQEEVAALEIELGRPKQKKIPTKNTSKTVVGRKAKKLDPDEKYCIQLWLDGKLYPEIDRLFVKEKRNRLGKKWSVKVGKNKGSAFLTIKRAKDNGFIVDGKNGWQWNPEFQNEKVSENVFGHSPNS